MAFEATPAQGRAIQAVRDSEAFRVALRIGVSSRFAVLLVAIFAALSFGPASGGLARENAHKFDEPALTHALADPLLAPLARWDSVWYLRIADSGYGDSAPRAAFFPLYPLLVRGVATVLGGSHGALLVAAYLVSLAAFLGALTLLYRLTELELGRRLARPTLLLLAVFPAAVYFGAPYSESLFLLLAVGAFYAARTGRWAWAGACAGLASATRSAGLLLLLPLALIWWDSRPRRSRDAAWLALAPPGSRRTPRGSASPRATRSASWTSRTPGTRARRSRSPARGTASWPPWTGCASSRRARARPCTSQGRRRPVPDRRDQRDAVRDARVRGRGLRRRAAAPPAGVRGVGRASLVLPLTFPVTPQPLMSLPRFVAVLFPVFMWLAVVSDERRSTDLVVAVSALGLGLFTAQYATWHWIS